MTLAVGTALQNGTYVIDAWVADDAVGPLYLAMDVSRGQWIQLRVLGSRKPETLPDVSERQAFYRYLDQVNGLKHRALPQRLGGFEEEGVCYQTLANPAGMPLDRLIPGQAPLPPRTSLAVLRQLIEVLETLRPLGWAGLRLTPDQVWYAPEAKTITFTGFDLVQLPPAETSSAASDSVSRAESAIESTLVRGLTYLLYFLLTGQRAEATKAPLTVEFRRCHPALPTSLDAALEAGSPAAGQLPKLSLTDWTALLPADTELPPAQLSTERSTDPAAPAAAPPSTGPATVVVASRSTSVSQLEPQTWGRDRPRATAASTPSRRSSTTLALALTGLVATVSGLGLGLYARLQPATSANPERLNPNQSFPPLPDWDGSELWQPWNDAPALRDRPDYGNTPPPGSEPAPDFAPDPQEPAAPPPAVPQPQPTSDPVAEPEESWEEPWETPVEPWPQPGEPALPADPPPQPSVAPVPAPEPLAPPAPLEAPPLTAPPEGAAPAPITAPTRPPAAPAPASS
ncbi:hypothetical protein C7293_01845 [filamentous cyanobacterium CCT1]|nr:hypothetical protein C7293_01845 [filamentous cyanobacterium CCT1]PSN80934.1 hypothetical protein C8B47_04000 [filamentous cyanobacterium CCP4]